MIKLDLIYLISFALFVASHITWLLQRESWNPTIKSSIFAARILSSLMVIESSIFEIISHGPITITTPPVLIITVGLALLALTTLFFHDVSWSGAKILWTALTIFLILVMNEVILHTIPLASNHLRLYAGISLIIICITVIVTTGIIVFDKKEITDVAV